MSTTRFCQTALVLLAALALVAGCSSGTAQTSSAPAAAAPSAVPANCPPGYSDYPLVTQGNISARLVPTTYQGNYALDLVLTGVAPNSPVTYQAFKPDGSPYTFIDPSKQPVITDINGQATGFHWLPGKGANGAIDPPTAVCGPLYTAVFRVIDNITGQPVFLPVPFAVKYPPGMDRYIP